MADGVDVTVDPAGAVTYEEMEDFVEDALEELVPATEAEIDEALGLYGDGGEGGEIPGGTTGVGTLDHSQLYNRNIEDQHTIEAITGLEEALAAAQEPVMDTTDVDSLWNEVMTGEGE